MKIKILFISFFIFSCDMFCCNEDMVTDQDYFSAGHEHDDHFQSTEPERVSEFRFKSHGSTDSEKVAPKIRKDYALKALYIAYFIVAGTIAYYGEKYLKKY